MASVGNCTVTAPTGPGLTVTSLVLNSVRSLEYDFPGDMVYIKLADGKVRDFDLNTIATITQTVSGNTHTVTITT